MKSRIVWAGVLALRCGLIIIVLDLWLDKGPKIFQNMELLVVLGIILLCASLAVPKSDIVTLREFNELLAILVRNIKADPHFKPDTIVALSTGGFVLAAALAKQLGIKSENVIGLAAKKGNPYTLDEQLIVLKRFDGRRVLVVDEASKSGRLCEGVVQVISALGGLARSCVLIAWKDGIQPYYVARTCEDEPPKFFWEVMLKFWK